MRVCICPVNTKAHWKQSITVAGETRDTARGSALRTARSTFLKHYDGSVKWCCVLHKILIKGTLVIFNLKFVQRFLHLNWPPVHELENT